jgi:UDPglucose--hexose-1-phosphate uridylyltransferase
VAGADIRSDEVLSKHADWVDALRGQYCFTKENTADILLKETGKVFSEVLEDAGVYKNTPAGKAAFLRFVEAVNA